MYIMVCYFIACTLLFQLVMFDLDSGMPVAKYIKQFVE